MSLRQSLPSPSPAPVSLPRPRGATSRPGPAVGGGAGAGSSAPRSPGAFPAAVRGLEAVRTDPVPVEEASGGAALGMFLRALRNRCQPQEVGLSGRAGPAGLSGSGAYRRVPGLRRQEVADLAGVSLDYYTRIEQGRCGEVSGAVLTSLARALRATVEETAHLHRLAAPPSHRRHAPAPAPLRPSLLALADAFAVPAVVIGPSLDVVSANLLWRLLVTPPGEPLVRSVNLATHHFLDPHAHVLFPDWHEAADATVARLRVQAALHPDDERVQQVVRELSGASPDFRRRWSVPQVRGAAHGRGRVVHPRAGTYTFDYETLQTPGGEGLVVASYSPVPGTGAQDVLDALVAGHRRDLGGA
ncbi:helix-turn-helix transcriptional regulator [Kineococcus radiotolerans]|uniref:helix-turn-helix transcriptional regulator n=1 Tax=Kineococcus radiotolerans TaxID=131568 RepID=UPI0006768C38|nr:helix-turn-helix transcriptional regulator [Kineococcus radiotolerans]